MKKTAQQRYKNIKESITSLRKNLKRLKKQLNFKWKRARAISK